ncbi:MAG: hypothetical protein K1V98_05990 [Prevotella sp.]|uniref:Uncharacterized protein n=2 Tax=Xylanibacter rodentium TaxID=2736289 RepID=A0ABX2AUC0_9BACT|nr:hypothetical protein [Prevotella sp. PJ1A]NPE14352.1 hypothetical protein [Xylanibacter rodentium]NPE39949.1 hypothetical protein [Prevotella sp. PCJ2]
MLSRRYLRQSVWLTAGMFIAGLLVMNVLRLDAMLTPLVVSAVFSMVTDTADAMIWRRVAERNPEGLTTFYTAVSGFRMLLALGVMMVCYLVVGRDAMTVFFLVFMSFYVMLLVHHAVFFGKVSNRS